MALSFIFQILFIHLSQPRIISYHITPVPIIITAYHCLLLYLEDSKGENIKYIQRKKGLRTLNRPQYQHWGYLLAISKTPFGNSLTKSSHESIRGKSNVFLWYNSLFLFLFLDQHFNSCNCPRLVATQFWLINSILFSSLFQVKISIMNCFQVL